MIRKLLLLLFFTGFFTIGKAQVYLHEGFTDSVSYSGFQDHSTTADGGNVLLFNLVDINYNSSLYVVKLSVNGLVEWKTRVRGNGTYQCGSIAQAADGSYFFATVEQLSYNHNVYALSKLDINGNISWLKYYSKDSMFIYPESRCAAVRDGFVIGGELIDTAQSLDYFHLFKVDTAGTLQWSRNVFNCSGKSWFHDLTTCRNGDIALCGDQTTNFQNPVIVVTDSFGNLRWAKEYQFGAHSTPARIVQCKDGGFAIAGSYFDATNAHYDGLLFHTDSAGNATWSERFYSSITQPIIGCDVRQCGNGDYLFLLKQGILMETDSTGNRLWMKQFQGVVLASLDTNTTGISIFGNGNWQSCADFFQVGPNGELPCTDSLLHLYQSPLNPATVVQTGSNPMSLQTSTPSYTLLTPVLYSTVLCTNIDPKGIDEQAESDAVKIFPVPAVSVLHVQCKTAVQRASLINALGQIIRVFLPASSGFQLDISSLPPGIYFLKLETGETTFTKKIIIGE